jgi:hypothetical protein
MRCLAQWQLVGLVARGGTWDSTTDGGGGCRGGRWGGGGSPGSQRAGGSGPTRASAAPHTRAPSSHSPAAAPAHSYPRARVTRRPPPPSLPDCGLEERGGEGGVSQTEMEVGGSSCLEHAGVLEHLAAVGGVGLAAMAPLLQLRGVMRPLRLGWADGKHARFAVA